MYTIFNSFTLDTICTCDSEYKAEQIVKVLTLLYGTEIFDFRKED